MKRVKAFRLLGLEAHTKREWWGYSIELKAGRDAANWWKQVMCPHAHTTIWLENDRKIKRCIRCDLVRHLPPTS